MLGSASSESTATWAFEGSSVVLGHKSGTTFTALPFDGYFHTGSCDFVKPTHYVIFVRSSKLAGRRDSPQIDVKMLRYHFSTSLKSNCRSNRGVNRPTAESQPNVTNTTSKCKNLLNTHFFRPAFALNKYQILRTNHRNVNLVSVSRNALQPVPGTIPCLYLIGRDAFSDFVDFSIQFTNDLFVFCWIHKLSFIPSNEWKLVPELCKLRTPPLIHRLSVSMWTSSSQTPQMVCLCGRLAV